MKIEVKRLKDFLLDAKLVTESEFSKTEKKAIETKKWVGDVLISEGFLTEEELKKVEAYILGIPFVDLEREKVAPDVLRLIPEPIARSHNIVSFRKKEGSLEVAMLDPEDLSTIDFIKKTAGLKILPRLTTSTSIKNVLRQYEETLEAEFGEIIKEKEEEIRIIKDDRGEEKKEELEKVAEEVPIIKIVDTLVKHAILQRASDIHIEPQEKELVVRYRVDGILRDAMILPSNVESGMVARIKILSNLKLDEHRLPQDGRFTIETEDYKYAVRVSILPVAFGEKIVMRLLPETNKALTLEEVGLWGKDLEKVSDNLKKSSGMILITGPTGSGKTTTLYSMLEILNTKDVNISTVEDPIEYQISRINQTQVRPTIGLTFASGLRALVRQDPDIIMVGEIRDNETVGLAINAALTGHLVLSTLHTISAAGAVSRLIDMKAEPFLISSTLNLIMAQRLVRRLHPEKEKYFLKDAEIKDLKKFCDLDRILKILKDEKIVKDNQTFKDIEFYRPKPSKDSSDGYESRIGIFEVLSVTPEIKDLVVKLTPSDKIQEAAIGQGMHTMMEDGFIKAAKGVTSIEEVLRAIIE